MLGAVLIASTWGAVRAQQSQTAPARAPQPPTTGSAIAAPLPAGVRGEPIYPAFEGWGPLQNGQNAILIGYSNQNKDQTLDIPVGPNNHMDPGGPDMLQPTHFEAGRQWGVFAVAVPKDFDRSKRISWTLIANGKPTTIQFSLNPPYWVNFYSMPAKGNTPPVIKFSPDGPALTGPPTAVALTLTATVGEPLALKLWATDKPNTYDPEDSLPPELRTKGRGTNGTANAAGATAPARGRGANGGADAQNFDLSGIIQRPANAARGGRGNGPQADVTVTWKVHRGAAPVKFADAAIKLFNKGDINAVMEAATTATFSAPGEYVLRAQVNDDSGDGGGGEQCCWTNALVRVNVK